MSDSKVFKEDINSIIADNNIPWQNLRNSSVLVTGATGTIGKVIVNIIGELNITKGFNVTLYAIGRNIGKGNLLEKFPGVKFIAADIREKLDIKYHVDYVIHCAAVTESSKMVADPVGVIETELQGIKNILEFARLNHIKGMVYTSSMEVYGLLDLPEVKETDLGYIDLISPRSSYPQSKRMVETMCNCYFHQYQIPVNIARLGVTFGAGADYENDKRVWAQFARCALNNSPIVLHTLGNSLTSLVYLADAIRGIFTILLTKTHGETYNIASTTLTIRTLAERVAKHFNLKVVIDQPKDLNKMGYASVSKLALNSDKVKSIGWLPQIYEIEKMFERLISDSK